MQKTVLSIQNLHKTYHQGQLAIPVLQNLGLKAQQGETIAILGESGSGKSTLLSLAAGLDQPDQGSIHIAGTDLASLSEQQRTVFRGQSLGIVFQSFHLLPHLSALENVRLPLEILGLEASKTKAAEFLDLVGLAHRQEHLPHQLSGGEKQRVAIARAFVHKPALILADEPSGNLDHETGERVMNLLFDLITQNQQTMILVTHSLSLAKRCQRTLMLASGALKDHVLDQTHQS